VPSFVSDILRQPLFPVAVLALVALLYWLGALAMRNTSKQTTAGDGGRESGEKTKRD